MGLWRTLRPGCGHLPSLARVPGPGRVGLRQPVPVSRSAETLMHETCRLRTPGRISPRSELA